MSLHELNALYIFAIHCTSLLMGSATYSKKKRKKNSGGRQQDALGM